MELKIGKLDFISMVDLPREFNKVREEEENGQHVQGRDYNN